MDLSKEEMDIVNQVEVLAFDQAGCRMIQKRLEDCNKNSPFVRCVLQNLLEILPNVMTNQFGNYLCQKLIEVCPVDSLKLFINAVLPEIAQVATDVHGTRAV